MRDYFKILEFHFMTNHVFKFCLCAKMLYLCREKMSKSGSFRYWHQIHLYFNQNLSTYRTVKPVIKFKTVIGLTHPFLIIFLVSPWRAMRSYQRHLKVMNPFESTISRTAFIRRSPSWGLSDFFTDVMKMPGDLCTAPDPPVSLADKVTLRASDHWLGTRTEAGDTAIVAYRFPSPFFFPKIAPN